MRKPVRKKTKNPGNRVRNSRHPVLLKWGLKTAWGREWGTKNGKVRLKSLKEKLDI